MQNHARKMVAPIVITILSVILLILYFGYIIILLPIFFLKLILALVCISFTALSIATMVQRIREIQKGEEDDLSQY